jgi:hypothetical protein
LSAWITPRKYFLPCQYPFCWNDLAVTFHCARTN